MKTTICRSSALLVAVTGATLFASVVAAAQGTAVAPSHTVRPGETLWSLATIYLGDGHRWPELVRANDSVLADPRRVPAGTILVLPANARVRNSKATVVANGGMLFGPSDVAEASEPPERTVFFGRDVQSVVRLASDQSSGLPNVRDSLVASRVWQSLAAPFVATDSDVASAAQLEQSLDVRIVGDAGAQRTLMLRDRVRISGAHVSALAVGTRVTSFSIVRPIERVGVLLLPSGILSIDRHLTDGSAEGTVLAVFDMMTAGQKVLPLDLGGTAASRAVSSATAERAAGRVVWVERGALLPSLQHMMFVELTGVSTVKPGDHLTIHGGRAMPAAARERGELLGVAIVLRTSAHGATAMLVQQMQPGIGEGSLVDVSAKLP